MFVPFQSQLNSMLVQQRFLLNGSMFLTSPNCLSIYSLRIFSIAAVVCVFIVLPVNYHGQKMHQQHIPLQSLEVFTILNVQEGSKWYEIYSPDD